MVIAQTPTSANAARPAETGLGGLAAWCYDHRRRVLAGWLLAAVAIIGLAQWAGSRLDNNFALASSPSQQAQNLLASRFPSQEGDSADVVLRSPSPLDSPANAAAINRLVRSLQPLAHVSGVQSPLAPGASQQLSPNRRTGFVVVQFDAAAAGLPASAVQRVIGTARSLARPGLQVAVGGAPVEQVVSAAPGPAEMIGLLAAVVVMLLAFGSVVAMGLPILTALVGVGMGAGILVGLSHLITVPTFGPDMMIMIGLGVGIDYALFVVTRYRQGLAEQRPPRDATIVALSTAGRAVLFAGATVVIALLGLFAVGLPFMDGLAAATIVAVALVLVAALTLLPAIFGFAGTAIDRLHIPGLLVRPGATASRGFWSRWSVTVQRRPWICAGSALAVLVVLALPLFSMRLAFSDAGNDPASLTTRQAYDLLAEGFGPGFNGPLVVAADLRGPHAQASIAQLDAHLSHLPGVASASPPVINAARDAAVIVVYPTTAPQSAQTASLVQRLRDQVIPQITAGRGDHRLRRGRDRRRSRHLGLPVRPAAMGDRNGGLAGVPSPGGGVPVHRHPGQGGRHEPALDRRGLRRRRRRLPVGMARQRLRGQPPRAAGPLDPAHDVHHRVRPVDGLRSLPPLPHARGMDPKRRQLQSGDQGDSPPPHGSSQPPPPSWSAYSAHSSSAIRCGSSACLVWAWRSPSSLTPPWSAWCSCPPSCSSLGPPTGGCPAGSGGRSPTSPSSRTGIT